MGFAPEPGEYDGKPVPQEPETRYVLRAMTLEDAHKQGFSTKWFDERALSREHLVNEMTDTVDHYLDSRDATHAVLEGFVSWPTQDGP